MDIKTQVIEIAGKAKKASAALGRVNSEEKNNVLLRMAEALVERRDFLMAENAKDLEYAEKAGLSPAMLDRLTLKESTIEAMAGGLKEVAALPDPVGKVTSMWRRPNGLLVGRMRIRWELSASFMSPVRT